MDYAQREFLRTFRRVLGGFLALTLLVAFWADRPLAAASQPKPNTDAILRGETESAPTAVEPTGTFVISLVRRPWLMAYTIFGAPPLNRGALTEAEESQFRRVVGSLALGFFALAGILWSRGQRLIRSARNPT